MYKLNYIRVKKKVLTRIKRGDKLSLTFLDFFAGVGGFRRGMEMAGHTCLGHCEIDKFANMSYKEIHQPKEEEWFGTDIRRTNADELPRADVWCFGFPCQDISVAGKQLGFKGQRSSLFFTVTRLVRDTKEEDRPKYLFIENVKNLLSVNGGSDFLKLLIELDEIGYDAEWQVLNSKNFGVPQNRERVFIIGHLRGRSGRKVFPIEGNCETVKIEESRQSLADYRYDEGLRIRKSGESPCLKANMHKMVSDADLSNAIYVVGNTNSSGNGMNGQVYDSKGFRIRKLTPKECWRLQGWNDEDFEKVAKVCSDSQLYKQAGNGVTVNVIYEIAKRLES